MRNSQNEALPLPQALCHITAVCLITFILQIFPFNLMRFKRKLYLSGVNIIREIKVSRRLIFLLQKPKISKNKGTSILRYSFS
jgi:hypothetical protein